MVVTVERIEEVLKKYDCTAGTFARLAGVSETHLSNIMRGEKPLVAAQQKPFGRAISFIVELQRSVDVPVNYHSYRRIAPHWINFLRTLDGANGVERPAAD